VPALRERPRDLEALSESFLRGFAELSGSEPAVLGDSARATLARRRLPGNVRELENLMRRAALLFPGKPVELARLDAPMAPTRESRPLEVRSLDLRELERAAITRSLEASGGNRTLAAQALGISVRTLRNKIHRYGLH
jgi:DNA-binding NtrC family response regulator